MRFRGIISGGKFLPEDTRRHAIWLERNEGRRVWSELKRDRPNRSNEQNRYLWGCVYKELSDTTGYSSDEIHLLCKAMFLRKVTGTKPKKIEIGGIQAFDYGSTRKLTTTEFNDYFGLILDWAMQELDIYIPEPNAAPSY